MEVLTVLPTVLCFLGTSKRTRVTEAKEVNQ